MGRCVGLGRKPGKKRFAPKAGTKNAAKAAARDAAQDARDAAALVAMANPSPATTGARTPGPRAEAVPGGARFFREQLEKVTADRDKQQRLKNGANARARVSEKAAERESKLAAKRMAERDAARISERAWGEELHEMEGLADERLVSDLPAIGRESRVGSGKGEKRWPMWMVQLIIELLVNGVHPRSIPTSILAQDRITTGRTGQEVPSVNFCRDMRVVLRILAKTLAAYQLALKGQWHQLFVDGTSRRQVALETLVIALENEAGDLKPLILSCACVVEGETSEQTCEAVLKEIEEGATLIQDWREVHQRKYPDGKHDIPDAKEMNVGKLGRGAISTDTANAARKQRRLLGEAIAMAAAEWHELDRVKDCGDERLYNLEVDCWNHLRNVWLGGMAKALGAHLNHKLRDSLEVISQRLRVSTSMESVLRALDKEFSINANYAKGHGDLFYEWMHYNHPEALLLHVERAGGSRQDLAVEGAGALYYNRVYYIEFLDERLRACGTEGNILQENLFIILSSLDMVAQARICSIVHLSICLPMRWLAGNSHKLAEYDWSVRSMGRAADMLQTALEAIEADPHLFLDQDFMFGIFDKLIDELPPFKAYLEYMYESKAMSLVGSSATNILPLASLRDELFHPDSETNQDTDDVAMDLAQVAATALLAELRDEKKATAEHLSSAEGKFSWDMTTEEDHQMGLGKFAVNDPAESSFGGLTQMLKCFGRIALASAGGVAQARWNGDLKRQCTSHGKAAAPGEDGIFHQLSEEMQSSLLMMCMEKIGATRAADQAALKAQREAKRRKEELKMEACMERGQEAFIDALYLLSRHVPLCRVLEDCCCRRPRARQDQDKDGAASCAQGEHPDARGGAGLARSQDGLVQGWQGVFGGEAHGAPQDDHRRRQVARHPVEAAAPAA